MTYATITATLSDGVATLTLNRPQVMNALSSQMRAELIAAMADLVPQARCLVLTGAGRGFCSGQDLADFGGGIPDVQGVLDREYVPLLTAIYDCPIPTISAVNGPAVGAGANLALAADVVIAAHSASFTQAFARIGLMPDAGGTWWLPRQMGMARAMGAALFAETITAPQAEAWGLIWQAVPDDDFVATVAAQAGRLAQGPTAAYRAAKTALRAAWGNTLPEQLALEARLQGDLARTRDFAEGVGAFLQKRAPRFQGR